jgi:hypothetical protein
MQYTKYFNVKSVERFHNGDGIGSAMLSHILVTETIGLFERGSVWQHANVIVDPSMNSIRFEFYKTQVDLDTNNVVLYKMEMIT